MKILALEFCSAQRSVAVRDTAASSAGQAEVVSTGGRAVSAFRMIEEALRAAQLDRKQIDCLAIGRGPGSYTGIRAAIALAQGWQLAAPIRLIGISSVECMAAQAHENGMRGPVHFVVDAQRNEFYLAGYELNADGLREIEPLCLATKAEVEEHQRLGPILGPDITSSFASAIEMFPRAGTLARLAASRTDFTESLEPIYLREVNFVKAAPPRKLPL
jgi:tRNA threonylcarbamoyl adenosine modification protein YeaZ